MEIRDALALERESNSETSYVSLFATPGNRKRMRIIIGKSSIDSCLTSTDSDVIVLHIQHWVCLVNGGKLSSRASNLFGTFEY